MPKVVHLTTVHPSFDTRIFYRQAKTLAQAGYNVTLIAQHDGNVTTNGINIKGLPKPRNRLHRMFGLTWQAFRLALKEKANLYHFHDPELLPVGVLLKIFTNAKVIYDVHEDYILQMKSKSWIPKGLRTTAGIMIDVIEKLVVKCLDSIVAATPAIAHKFPKEKTVVVRNFPRLEELVFSSSARPYTQRPPWVVYLGGITAIRGAVEMVEAIARVQTEAELVLAGAFESDALRGRLAQRPGWQRTRFVGWLNRTQIADLLGQARVGLVLLAPVPRHKVAWPEKLFEYMAAGIPFVASDFPLWRQIGEGAGLFVDPRDPDAIAQAIQWLLTHPREAQAMGERGRHLVETQYNWEHEVQELLRLYARLLA